MKIITVLNDPNIQNQIQSFLSLQSDAVATRLREQVKNPDSATGEELIRYLQQFPQDRMASMLRESIGRGLVTPMPEYHGGLGDK